MSDRLFVFVYGYVDEIRKDTIIVKRNKCDHKNCPLQYNYVSDDCDISECPWRTVGKQGRWIDMDDHVMCSCCGATHYGVDKNYCPNCGAYMIKK